MIRVHIICEGQTEEDFIKEVLRPHFSQKGIAVYPSLIGKPGHKGGNFKIERLLNDVRNRNVQMHEFEALLFSDPIIFAKSIDKPAIASELLTIRNSFASPEEINDGPMTAPSKRILTLIAEYQKPTMGVIGALEISLPVLRHECQLFNKWLCCLEQLSS
ncbi:DUF4276 family protein [Cylindrospermopsis raciborskii]|uniref:DUF4276 family protein n=2 Tax=Cylindrospermopsis raciborskii TaxID=77022 RepID=A0A838WY03_9CYAN|nr:DUF4276 family protein [Cylindrospermopsis raciborskii]MBA4446849.1 DUF4276 family protein [Cylindrospermopsis raciborskii CS-506_C]MBA4451086.1 DUF4276 family protein [Cylindrospermopsis raciborskii CS-506_D]MBA4457691.1 DUF4276 family protein [Cylindrospermopsis raciborskii CS-506_B]MBA4467059.1 DUF4276 family protein [Cylindrospermopsis raciborskii CS-506_A]OHY37368.1 hypothetical protein BCV63_14035 [Cylindrospermopsis raciborskii CS-508]